MERMSEELNKKYTLNNVLNFYLFQTLSVFLLKNDTEMFLKKKTTNTVREEAVALLDASGQFQSNFCNSITRFQLVTSFAFHFYYDCHLHYHFFIFFISVLLRVTDK